jgi:hypothetical protein
MSQPAFNPSITMRQRFGGAMLFTTGMALTALPTWACLSSLPFIAASIFVMRARPPEPPVADR